jgi:hypothetical protein
VPDVAPRIMSPMASPPVTCDLCGRPVPTHASYVVRIDVYADPSLPEMTGEELAAIDFDAALTQVIDEAKGMTADDLQDGVHRRFEHRLCPACHKAYLANPLGKPRGALRSGAN